MGQIQFRMKLIEKNAINIQETQDCQVENTKQLRNTEGQYGTKSLSDVL